VLEGSSILFDLTKLFILLTKLFGLSLLLEMVDILQHTNTVSQAQFRDMKGSVIEDAIETAYLSILEPLEYWPSNEVMLDPLPVSD
jgi:hypothetical protein